MTTWLIRRLIQALFVVLAMSVIVFVGVHVIGNPVDILISPEADQAERVRIIAALGLDQPLWKQYLLFVNDALHGNLGRSFVFNEPALRLIAQRMPATMELAVTAVLMSVLFGIPLGLYAGLYPDGAVGRTIMAGSILGFSLPTFWVGLMLIMVFAVQLGWLPSTGRGDDGGAVGHSVVVPDARRAAASAAAGFEFVAVQHFVGAAPDPCRCARDTADGLREVRPRQGVDAGAA